MFSADRIWNSILTHHTCYENQNQDQVLNMWDIKLPPLTYGSRKLKWFNSQCLKWNMQRGQFPISNHNVIIIHNYNIYQLKSPMKNFWDHQTFKSFKHGFKNTQDVYSYLCPNVYPIIAPRFTPRFTHCFIGLSMDIARLRVLPKVADWLTQSSALNFLWFDRSWHHPGLLTLMWYWLRHERSVRLQQVLETHRFSQGGSPDFPKLKLWASLCSPYVWLQLTTDETVIEWQITALRTKKKT